MADPATNSSDAAQVQQAIKEAQAPQAPIEIKTETGSVFKGTTDEIIEQMKKSIEHGTRTIYQNNQELERLRSAAQTPQTPTPQTPVSADDQVNAKYWEKWQKSPVEAQDYIDSVRLGVPEEQVRQVLRGTLQQTQVTLQQQGGAEFQQRCPDFPSSPEASQALVAAMKQRYGNSTPSSAAELADRLEVTYGQLVRNGQITPADLPIARNGAGPIPALGGGGQQSSMLDVTNEADFRRLSPEKMREVIERLAAQGRR